MAKGHPCGEQASTLTGVIKAVSSCLFEAGYAPQALRMSSYDSTSVQGAWKVSGTFQNGFLGEYLGFEIDYDPVAGTARMLNVTEVWPRIG